MIPTAVSATALLAPGLLEDLSVTVVGTRDGAGEEVGQGCEALGAAVTRLGPDALDGDEPERSAPPAAAAGTHAVVVDVAALGRSPSPMGRLERLGLGLDRTWAAIRALAVVTLIPGGGGKVVLLAPRPIDGSHATPARAGVENLARTLSVEWARHRVTVVAVMPHDLTGDRELAAVVAYLVSAAGDYFSGCRLELGAPRGARRRPSLA